MPRRHDAVADLNRGRDRKIEKPRRHGVVAGQYRPLARPLDDDGDPAIQVVDQQHARRPLADLRDAAQQALPGERRIALRHAVAAPGIDEQAAHERPSGIADHARGDRCRVLRRREVQQLM